MSIGEFYVPGFTEVYTVVACAALAALWLWLERGR